MSKLVLTACLGCLLTALPPAAIADSVVPTPAETKATADGPREWRTLQLQYAKPSIVAWWLDPAHQAEPIEFVEGRKLLESAGIQASGMPVPDKEPAKRKGVFELPAGVTEIKINDAQRSVSALATEKGFEELKQIIGFLDKPMRTVGISAEVIESDDITIRQLGGNFAAALNPDEAPRAQMTYVKKEAPAELQTLIATGAVRVLASYQLTAKNNLPIGDTAMLEGFGQNEKQPALLRLIATPSINSDNTITVFLNLSGQESSSPSSHASSHTFRTTTILNVKNRDSLLIDGLNLAFWKAPQAASPANPVIQQKKLYVLLRAQILEGKRLQ